MTASTLARSWAVPGARQLLPAGAPRDVWLAERRNGIGGSDAAAICGLSRWRSPYEVWAEKRGLIPEQEQNEAMAWGLRHEPAIAEWFVEKTGIEVRRAGLLASRERPWQRVSLDRLTADGGIGEFKTLTFRMSDEWADDDAPDAAVIQGQHGLAVSGRPGPVWIVGLVDGWRAELRRVERDEKLIEDLTALEAEFWDLVLSGRPPPVDGSDSTTRTLRQLYPKAVEGRSAEVDAATVATLIKAKRDADAALKSAEWGKAMADNALKELCGDYETVTVAGMPAVSYKQNGNFREDQFAEAAPDVFDDYLRAVDALDLKRLKTERPELYQAHRGRRLHIAKGF